MKLSSNEKKLVAQEKMRNGELMGHIDPTWARTRYVDDAAPIETLCAEMGVSVIQARRYLQAFGIHRDRGHLVRAGVKKIWNTGRRDPAARRNRPKTFMSPEHREKLADAKRGRTGEKSNRWKGGHVIGGYTQKGGGSNRRYEHRELAEQLLGRKLNAGEQVHHMDKDRANNVPSNLLVLYSADHTRLHIAMRRHTELDQRAWLIANDIQFEDLQTYA